MLCQKHFHNNRKCQVVTSIQKSNFNNKIKLELIITYHVGYVVKYCRHNISIIIRYCTQINTLIRK